LEFEEGLENWNGLSNGKKEKETVVTSNGGRLGFAPHWGPVFAAETIKVYRKGHILSAGGRSSGLEIGGEEEEKKIWEK